MRASRRLSVCRRRAGGVDCVRVGVRCVVVGWLDGLSLAGAFMRAFRSFVGSVRICA